MNGPGQQRRHPPAQNVPSSLLTDSENKTVFHMLGRKCVTLATGVVQVYLADGSGSKWQKRCTGVCCFVKDNPMRSYFIRVYSLKNESQIWEQELYNQFKYNTPRSYFHTFDTDKCRAGLNFANEAEASKFKQVVEEKIRQKQEKKQAKSRVNSVRSPNSALPSPPAAVHQQQQSSYNQQPAAPVHVEIKPQIEDGKKAKKGKKKKGKLTKADISMPSGFKHVGHVGWDPNKGFDTNNMDPDVKELFNNAGVTEDDMHDKEKAQFIYDFIEKRGGIDAVKQEQKQRGAPPPPPQRGTGGGPPPPPPQRGGPPPPPRKDASRSQPPPPHRSQGPPPPPPDRGNRQAQTPQPPRGREPPVLGGRMSHPPPPPRAPESIPPPPPPSASYAPPPPPSMPSNVPPPPPPPPPSSSAPPPPPPATGMGRGALLQQIRQGTGLKSASEPVKTTNRPAATGRDALLDDIRKGGIGGLKSVSHEQNDKPVASPPPEEGLAGALARALQKRENAIHSDSESDSDNEDFDDEEWSD